MLNNRKPLTHTNTDYLTSQTAETNSPQNSGSFWRIWLGLFPHLSFLTCSTHCNITSQLGSWHYYKPDDVWFMCVLTCTFFWWCLEKVAVSVNMALDSVAHWWFKGTRVAVIGVGTVLDIAVKFVSPRVNPMFLSCHAYACLAHLSCCEQETWSSHWSTSWNPQPSAQEVWTGSDEWLVRKAEHRERHEFITPSYQLSMSEREVLLEILQF